MPQQQPIAPDFGEPRLDALQRHAFDYFLHHANPLNGLVADTSRADSVASIAAVGFALAAYPVGVERGWMTRADALQRTLAVLRFFWASPHGGRCPSQGSDSRSRCARSHRAPYRADWPRRSGAPPTCAGVHRPASSSRAPRPPDTPPARSPLRRCWRLSPHERCPPRARSPGWHGAGNSQRRGVAAHRAAALRRPAESAVAEASGDPSCHRIDTHRSTDRESRAAGHELLQCGLK